MQSKKGTYIKISRSMEEKCYIVEMGTEFDCFRIAVDFVDLIKLKNELQEIEENAKRNEQMRKEK